METFLTLPKEVTDKTRTQEYFQKEGKEEEPAESENVYQNVEKKKKVSIFSSEETSSDLESSDASDLYGEGEYRRISRKKLKKSMKRASGRNRFGLSRKSSSGSYGVKDYLKKLDTRQMPQLEKYKEESGMSLLKYLDKFE